jgi:hypothetical protein
MARTAKREKGDAPAFNPAKWASQAARRVDITACTDALVDILASPESWESIDGDEGVRRARQQELAIALRRATPLYELTATLITPWLLEVCAPAQGRGAAAEPDTGAITANLAALMAHLFDAPGVLDYDPWSGLIEWVWSHQNALAIADLNRELGGARVRELSAQEYRRHLLAYLSGNAVAALRERSGHLLLTYAPARRADARASRSAPRPGPARRPGGAAAGDAPHAAIVGRPHPTRGGALDGDELGALPGAAGSAL